MARIGLTGLGTMGAALALNIAEKGFDLAVHNRSNDRVDDFIVLYEQAKLGMAETEHLLPTLGNSFGAGLLVYPLLLVLLVWLPLHRSRT